MLGHKEEFKSTATRILPGAPQEHVCVCVNVYAAMKPYTLLWDLKRKEKVMWQEARVVPQPYS